MLGNFLRLFFVVFEVNIDLHLPVLSTNNIMSCLIWIQTVSHSDGIPEIIKLILEKTKDSKKHALYDDDDKPS